MYFCLGPGYGVTGQKDITSSGHSGEDARPHSVPLVCSRLLDAMLWQGMEDKKPGQGIPATGGYTKMGELLMLGCSHFAADQ